MLTFPSSDRHTVDGGRVSCANHFANLRLQLVFKFLIRLQFALDVLQLFDEVQIFRAEFYGGVRNGFLVAALDGFERPRDTGGCHAHVDCGQPFGRLLNVFFLLCVGHFLHMDMEFVCAVKDAPSDFVCVCADCLLHTLDAPVVEEVSWVPRTVVGFDFYDAAFVTVFVEPVDGGDESCATVVVVGEHFFRCGERDAESFADPGDDCWFEVVAAFHRPCRFGWCGRCVGQQLRCELVWLDKTVQSVDGSCDGCRDAFTSLFVLETDVQPVLAAVFRFADAIPVKAHVAPFVDDMGTLTKGCAQCKDLLQINYLSTGRAVW